ncbi:hypothetical protein MASR2M36_36880 [Providencia sp.]
MIGGSLTLSILVLAGASEFLFIGVIFSGGSPISAALAGLLVNSRHIPFSFAVSELTGKEQNRCWVII